MHGQKVVIRKESLKYCTEGTAHMTHKRIAVMRGAYIYIYIHPQLLTSHLPLRSVMLLRKYSSNMDSRH